MQMKTGDKLLTIATAQSVFAANITTVGREVNDGERGLRSRLPL